MDVSKTLFKIFQYAMFLVLPGLQAEEVIKYYSPPVSGPANYSLHNLDADGIRIQNVSSITFQVKCLGFAYILLQKRQTDYNDKVVEIGLGVYANSAATISDKHNPKWNVYYREIGITSIFQYRHFWISWEGKTIRVGKDDTPYKQEFMKWDKLTHETNYISIATAYWTAGYWIFKTGQRSTPLPILSTEEAKSTSTAASHNTSKAKRDSNLIAVYISIPCVVVICIVAVVIFLWLRQKRKKKREESEAVHSTSNPTANNNALSGVMNQTYNSHSTETRTNNTNNINVSILPDTLYTDIALNDNQKTEVFENEYNTPDVRGTDVRGNANGTMEVEYSYNHLTNSQLPQTKPHTSYSTTVVRGGGLKTEEIDMMYSHIGNYEAKTDTEGKVEAEDTYNKLNVKRKEVAIEQNGCFEEDENSVYDHAKSGGRNPATDDTDEYAHLN